MRMWGVDARKLCDKHLLGEHVELHMFVGCIRKGISLKGYIDKGLVEVHSIHSRHEELVREMLRRDFKHKSPLPAFKAWREGRIDMEKNLQELRKRCRKCNTLNKFL